LNTEDLVARDSRPAGADPDVEPGRRLEAIFTEIALAI
jgi:hypothetical protein